jgi:hypothetical protein
MWYLRLPSLALKVSFLKVFILLILIIVLEA